MNKRLKFSWAHIVAFVAIIVVSYISFMGLTYLSGGDFNVAVIGMAIIDVTILLMFVGVQQLKASGVNMHRKIVLERILILLSPIVFLFAMMPMSHFWTVYESNDRIVAAFKGALDNCEELFEDYEQYTESRIKDYGDILKSSGQNDRDIAIASEVLILQLRPQNFDTFKKEATTWIKNAQNDAGAWNVFLLGNTRNIKETIYEWDSNLKKLSKNLMLEEEVYNQVLNDNRIKSFRSNCVHRAINNIQDLTQMYSVWKTPNFTAVIFGIIVYFMLIFPYIVQERHTKSVYSLMGNKITSTKGTRHVGADMSMWEDLNMNPKPKAKPESTNIDYPDSF